MGCTCAACQRRLLTKRDVARDATEIEDKHDPVTGHRHDCQYVGNSGPPCVCDGIGNAEIRARVITVMKYTGWELDTRGAGTSFTRTIGDHLIMVSKVISGWQYKWCRTPTWTITEEGSFGTVQACVNDLWKKVAGIYDRVHEFDRQNAGQRSKEARDDSEK